MLREVAALFLKLGATAFGGPAAVLLFRSRLNSAWLILGGGALGWVIRFFAS